MHIFEAGTGKAEGLSGRCFSGKLKVICKAKKKLQIKMGLT